MKDTQQNKKMTMREKSLARRKAKREAEEQRRKAWIDEKYELIESGKLTEEQKKIMESDEYQNEWVPQQTRCFNRNGDELSEDLTLHYKEQTVNIVLYSESICIGIWYFEAKVKFEWEYRRKRQMESK